MLRTVFIISLFLGQISIAQVGIGTVTPDASSALEVSSTSAGMLIPRMSEAQRNGITSPATGLMVYQTDNLAGFWYYDGSNWASLSAPAASNVWNLNGNSGIDENVDFVGTTDDQDLVFKRNNQQVGRLTEYNVSFGESSIASPGNAFYNVAIGNNALENITNSSYNIAIGRNALNALTNEAGLVAIGNNALAANVEEGNTAVGSSVLAANTTGSYNTAMGSAALVSNVDGDANNGFGYQSMYRNVDGAGNNAFGYQSLRDNTSANFNSAFGHESMQLNTTGENNSVLGAFALELSQTGSNNTSVGAYSMRSNTSGEGNTALGNSALGQSNGNYNTAIGYLANPNASYTNSTALGYDARPSGDNTIRLGNSLITTIGGYANWTNVSDGRFKKNVRDDVPGIDFIIKLRPVTYTLDMEAIAKFYNTPDSLRLKDAERLKASEIQSGFIAQEVEQAAELVGYDFHGVDKPKNPESHYGLRYAEFVVPLVKAIQEQQQIIERQESAILELTVRLENLEAQSEIRN